MDTGVVWGNEYYEDKNKSHTTTSMPWTTIKYKTYFHCGTRSSLSTNLFSFNLTYNADKVTLQNCGWEQT